MNYFLFLIKTSFEDLRRNKVRTFLTSLGILIGVMSVVLLIAFGLGLKNYIKNQFESLGTNLVFVAPGKIVSGGGFRPTAGLGVLFDEKDVSRLKRIKEAERVAPVFVKTLTLSVASVSETVDVFASTGDLFTVRNLEVDKGILFTNQDVSKRSKKVVLGPKIAEKLFGSIGKAVGKSVRIQSQGFTVAGVLKKKGGGGFGGPDFDSFAYIPYKASSGYNLEKKFFAVYLKARSEKDIPVLKESIKKVLLAHYKEDDFSVVEQTEVLGILTSIFSILNSILIAIGSISLLVGGIGIMNIMYATVTERIKEIGIRRSVGATKRDILVQFLSQALILSLFGGVLGLLLAFIIVFFIRSFFPAAISPFSVVAALGVSSAIGIFFGVFPARRAANLSPIEAIRYE